MLHGDGQYSPLLIPTMISPIIKQNYEAFEKNKPMIAEFLKDLMNE